MIQLDMRVSTPRARKFVGGVGWVGGGWLTPTTYIQLTGNGSINQGLKSSLTSWKHSLDVPNLPGKTRDLRTLNSLVSFLDITQCCRSLCLACCMTCCCACCLLDLLNNMLPGPLCHVLARKEPQPGPFGQAEAPSSLPTFLPISFLPGSGAATLPILFRPCLFI